MAGWNPFKRTRPVKTAGDNTPQATVVKPLIREAHRREPSARGLPRFNTTAADQLSARTGDRISIVRSKLRHAFTPSQPVADRRLFAGRDDVLKTIIRSIEDQRLHIVLYGERGIGKTSLLHVLTQAATEARYIVVYASCGANSHFDETFRAAAAHIPLLFHSGFSPSAAETEKGSSLADLLPEDLSPSTFGELCTKLTGTRVLIILDEFDRATSGSFRRDVAELIKNLSDRLGRVQLVLAGVAADLTELVEHIPSIRRNIFALRIPKMTEAEVLQIVANGEREADIMFDVQASALLVEVARGSPYIANLICHHAGHAALDQGRSTVVPADISMAVERAIGEFQGRIATPAQVHVHRLFEQDKHEVLAMAARAALAVDGPFHVENIRSANEISARKAQEILDTLLVERLIRPIDDENGEQRYAFMEEGLPILIWMTWAHRNMNREPPKPRATTAAVS